MNCVPDKNFAFLKLTRAPSNLVSVLALKLPARVVLDPDRVQVVCPEPRTPSTLTINAALAVAQASVRPISVTKRLVGRA